MPALATAADVAAGSAPLGASASPRHACVTARSGGCEYLEVVAVVGVITAAGWFAPLTYHALGHLYLLAVMILGLRLGRGPTFFAAIISALAWNYVFIPPRLSFSVLDFDDALLLGTYFLVALVAGQLTARKIALLEEREHRREAAHREQLALASDQMHRTLLDCVSHELKTPVAILRSASEQLATAGDSRAATLATEIQTAARRLERLVANLLHQTRLEAGAITPRLDACDVRDLIAAARRAAGEPLAKRDVRLEIPAHLPLLQVDAALMEIVFANLLLNAALYTPAGTPITVAAGVSAGPRRVFVAVQDRGPGVPPIVRAHLFDKFTRGETRAGGVGLGLSIVRGFVLAHGGDVVLDDAPGGGARFTVLLPPAPHHGVPDE